MTRSRLLLLVLAVLCTLVYRSTTAGMLFMVPVIISNMLTFAFMTWTGIGMNINTLPVVALGIGLGGGTFGIATLTAAMTLPSRAATGLALGAWGAAQATAAGLAIFVGGAMRDGVAEAASAGMLGSLGDASLGYSFVYHTEIGLLFLTLVILGPLVRLGIKTQRDPDSGKRHIGLAEFPT